MWLCSSPEQPTLTLRYGRPVLPYCLGARLGEQTPLAADQVEVAEIDEEAGALAEDEDGVLTVDRVDEERQPPADREEPERERDHALAPALGRDPLHEKAHGEECLAQESHAEPYVIRHHGADLMESG